jgi:hypothetical protein
LLKNLLAGFHDALSGLCITTSTLAQGFALGWQVLPFQGKSFVQFNRTAMFPRHQPSARTVFLTLFFNLAHLLTKKAQDTLSF